MHAYNNTLNINTDIQLATYDAARQLYHTLKTPFIGQSWTLVGCTGRTIGITKLLHRMAEDTRKTRRARHVRNHLCELVCRCVVAYKAMGISHVNIPRADILIGRFLTYEEINSLLTPLYASRTLTTARSVWHGHNMSAMFGIMVDTHMKHVFQKRRPIIQMPEGIQDMSRVLCGVLGVYPLGADFKVASIIHPQHRAHQHMQTCCVCKPYVGDSTFVTAVDIVGYNATSRQLTLVEIKTFKGLDVDQLTLRYYQIQTWLSWLMFMLNHDIDPRGVTAKIVVLLPAANIIQFYNVSPPSLTAKLTHVFPFLKAMCVAALRQLVPGSVRPRIKRPFCTVDLATMKMYGVVGHTKRHTYRRQRAKVSHTPTSAQ